MARVVLLDENSGLYYTVLEDSLAQRKKRTKKVKFVRNERQAGQIKRIFESFNGYQSPGLVCSGLGTMLQSVVNGDCTSISLSTYRDEMQVTFWEKRGKGSEVLASFVFSSVESFVAALEELS